MERFVKMGAMAAIEQYKLAHDPNILQRAGAQIKQLGTATGAAINQGADAYRQATQSLPSTLGTAARMTEGVPSAISGALKGFYRNKGMGSILGLGGVGLGLYGAKTLYDRIRQGPQHSQPGMAAAHDYQPVF